MGFSLKDTQIIKWMEDLEGGKRVEEWSGTESVIDSIMEV